jgi:hypothetical protein
MITRSVLGERVPRTTRAPGRDDLVLEHSATDVRLFVPAIVSAPRGPRRG